MAGRAERCAAGGSHRHGPAESIAVERQFGAAARTTTAGHEPRGATFAVEFVEDEGVDCARAAHGWKAPEIDEQAPGFMFFRDPTLAQRSVYAYRNPSIQI